MAWNGPPRPDDKGFMAVDGFNQFLDGHRDVARSPIRATIEFVRLRDPSGETTSVRATSSRVENPDEVRVVLTDDGLPDDSVRTVRYVLQFDKRGQEWRLKKARFLQRCQPRRGHQKFSPQPCR